MKPRQNVSRDSDGISLPNLIDLPKELKMKILESFPGEDVARVSGVNREFRNLVSDDYLWKQKFLEEFAYDVTKSELSDVFHDWKTKFAKCCNTKKYLTQQGFLEEPVRYLSMFLEYDSELEYIKKEYGEGRMLTGPVKKKLIEMWTEMEERHCRARAAVTEEMVDAFMAVRPLPIIFQ